MSTRSTRSLTIALYLNAGLLALIALLLINRSKSPFESTAFGQSVQPIAGGAGFYLMPAQFSPNAWGCYVMDVDAQTLVAYVYDQRSSPATLRLAAARSFAFDRQLRSYNTQPAIEEIEQIIRTIRDNAGTTTSDGPATRPVVP
jgi:hypothetical protein